MSVLARWILPRRCPVGKYLSLAPCCRFAKSWARYDGRRPRAVVVHPRLKHDNEKLVPFDVAEAVALGKALKWDVVGVDSYDDEESTEDEDERSIESGEEEESSDEEETSVLHADGFDVMKHVVRMDRVDQKFFFPTGTLCRLAVLLVKLRGDILFINAALSPQQQRHLEMAMDLVAGAQQHRGAQEGRQRGDDEDSGAFGMKINVFDRARVILAIFAQRASTPIAKLRIELAEADLLKAKLGASAASGAKSSLQKVSESLAKAVAGGDKSSFHGTRATRGVDFSFQSSPQLTRQKQKHATEATEKKLKGELAKLQAHRAKSRQHRKRQTSWVIALAGYTNAGKSQLVNSLTGASLFVKDGVFVTLDVAARMVTLPSGAECYVLDSVGFVRDLPVELCEAFVATVEELQEADLVLHVRDISHPLTDTHRDVVREVLEKAGVDVQRKVLEVWNKKDLLSEKALRQHVLAHREKDDSKVYPVSAISGEGVDELLVDIQDRLEAQSIRIVEGSAGMAIEVSQREAVCVELPPDLSPDEAAARWAFLREYGKVSDDGITSTDDGKTVVEVLMDVPTQARYVKRFGTEFAAKVR